jgi:hypothetical protein
MPTSKYPASNVRIITAWISPKTGRPISPDYQRRLIRNGIGKRSFESGAAARSGKVTAARSHAETPEHGARDAVRRPEKFRKYLEKKDRELPPVPEGEPTKAERRLAEIRFRDNMKDKVGNYHKFVELHVRERASLASWSDLQIGIHASEGQIRLLAADPRPDNPFQYH